MLHAAVRRVFCSVRRPNRRRTMLVVGIALAVVVAVGRVPQFDAAEAKRPVSKLAAAPLLGRTERRTVQRDVLGATEKTEKAVAAALNWLVRHQLPDGSWSIDGYRVACKDPSCLGLGRTKAPSAATALALLPMLGAGYSPRTRGPYQKAIQAGLAWMIRNEKANGDLRAGNTMYSHGLATLALCEAFALSANDRTLEQAAQQAVNFIQAAQHPGGGWRYAPGEDGDLSVVSWQVMALITARWANLRVDQGSVTRAIRYVESCAKTPAKGVFGYRPETGPTASMTAAGLLCSQHLGMARDDPAMVEGLAFLTKELAVDNSRSFYQWYYCTYALRNVPGAEWEQWNKQISGLLVAAQETSHCAAGSWDPLQPAKEAYGEYGGRHYTTAFGALILESYYRYPVKYGSDGP